MEESDTALLEAYREGSAGALGRLMERHERMLFGFIRTMTGCQADADDIYQEVWLRVIRKGESFKEGNFGGWLVRIARNVIIDNARKRKPSVSLDAELSEGVTMAGVLAGPGFDASETVADDELGRRIASAVSTLPAEQKEVFLLRVQADMPFKEIARLQKVSINTALARMQYALAKLRDLLKKEYEVVAAAP
jgi:RNA polymerase sigma-70 factor (ECF subfamily)